MQKETLHIKIIDALLICEHVEQIFTYVIVVPSLVK